jgi:ureidoglycolate lyase
MIVVGSRPIDFVVVQFANDVGVEDCQEVKWDSRRAGISVAVPEIARDRLAWKL